MTGFSIPPVINPLHPRYTMANNTLDKAIAAVPKFGDRISLFTKKLRLALYADGSIYDYRLKIAQAVLFTNKLPEEFTQTDSTTTCLLSLVYFPVCWSRFAVSNISTCRKAFSGEIT